MIFWSFYIRNVRSRLGITLDLPLNIIIENSNNDIANIILFMQEGYFLGLILQEIACIWDRKVLKFREKAMANFLNENNKIITNILELKDFRILANNILNVQESNCEYNEDQSRKVYHNCKTYLEVYEKDTKVKRINSLYAISRSLMVLFFVYAIIYFLLYVPTFDCKDFDFLFGHPNLYPWKKGQKIFDVRGTCYFAPISNVDEI